MLDDDPAVVLVAADRIEVQSHLGTAAFVIPHDIRRTGAVLQAVLHSLGGGTVRRETRCASADVRPRRANKGSPLVRIVLRA